ncbi:MAG TPA: 30S ribosomal protein S16 [Candidatus Paceibacterota bacterium]
MLKIRMQRIGRTNDPAFRIVVIEHTASPKAGTFVEKLGTYNPKTKERTLNAERVKYWLSVGAKASGTMHNMLIREGVIQGKKINVLPRKSPPKVEAPTEVTTKETSKEESASAVEAPAPEEQKTENTEAPVASA